MARVHDRGDGTYRVTYSAAVSGTCAMAVTLGKQHIQGSPFRLTVADGHDAPLHVAAVASRIYEPRYHTAPHGMRTGGVAEP